MFDSLNKRLTAIGATFNKCEPGEKTACGTDVGECDFGEKECTVDGVWEECTGGVTPVDEICGDGVDNDCDGHTDNDDTDCCVPKTCEDVGRECGEIDNGCGRMITCGECNDGLVCTKDVCDGVCYYIIDNGWCLIEGTCYEQGEWHPFVSGPLGALKHCQECKPEINNMEWSSGAECRVCAPGSGAYSRRCLSGNCTFDFDYLCE